LPTPEVEGSPYVVFIAKSLDGGIGQVGCHFNIPDGIIQMP